VGLGRNESGGQSQGRGRTSYNNLVGLSYPLSYFRVPDAISSVREYDNVWGDCSSIIDIASIIP